MSQIVQKAEDFVTELLENKLDPNFLYHNLKHTQRVVKSTAEILEYYELSETENEQLTLAAWFHDTGYAVASQNHEEESCKIAREFFGKENYDADGIDTIERLIMATKMEYEPKSLDEEIIRDADASHFAQKSYWETTDFFERINPTSSILRR